MHLVDTRLTLKGANLVQKKTPNLIFSKLGVYFVAHSGIINIIFAQQKINTIKYISVDYGNSS